MFEAYLRDPERFERADQATLAARVAAVVEKLRAAEGSVVVAVAHHDLIQSVCKAMGLRNNSLDNAQVRVIDFEELPDFKRRKLKS